MEKIKKLSKDVNTLLNDKDFCNKNFMLFTKLITNKKNLELLKSFFLALYQFYDTYQKEEKKTKYPKVDINLANIKIFFSYFTIIYYPDIMNYDPKSITFKNMKSKGSTMKIYLLIIINFIKENEINTKMDKDKLVMRVKEFMNEYYFFIGRFKEWKNLDKECLIYELTRVYFNLKEDFKKIDYSDKENSKELYEITKQSVEMEKQKTMEKILLIDREKGEEKFSVYMKLLVDKQKMEMDRDKYIDNLMESIQNNIKKSFWDIIKEDLEQTPPKTLSFINNLKELKNTIVCCVNKKVELREELNKVIDVELIEQMIRHGAYHYEDLVIIVEYINSLLCKFQSPSEDENTEKYKKKINEMIEKQENIIDVLIFFLSSVMPKFENILLFRQNFINKELSKK